MAFRLRFDQFVREPDQTGPSIAPGLLAREAAKEAAQPASVPDGLTAFHPGGLAGGVF